VPELANPHPLAMIKQYTITFPLKENKILLGMKKQGFGQGKYNGFGGKIESEETPEAAAIRELWEESSLKTTKVTKAGELLYKLTEDEAKWQFLHIYICREFDGEPQESTEMVPEWFEIGEAPFDKMWLSFKVWLPEVLDGKFAKGTSIYDNNYQFIKADINFEIVNSQ